MRIEAVAGRATAVLRKDVRIGVNKEGAFEKTWGRVGAESVSEEKTEEGNEVSRIDLQRIAEESWLSV